MSKIARRICRVVFVGACLDTSLVQGCPTCFSGSAAEVLNTYYLSAFMLSLLPFGILAGILGWIVKTRKTPLDKSMANDSQAVEEK